MRKTVDGTFKDVLQKAKICGAAEGENNPFKMLRYVDGRNTMLMGLNKQEKIMVQKTREHDKAKEKNARELLFWLAVSLLRQQDRQSRRAEGNTEKRVQTSAVEGHEEAVLKRSTWEKQVAITGQCYARN